MKHVLGRNQRLPHCHCVVADLAVLRLQTAHSRKARRDACINVTRPPNRDKYFTIGGFMWTID